MFALLRALSALRNLIFSRPLGPGLSHRGKGRLRHRPRSSHGRKHLPLRREKGDLEILEELIDQYVKSLNDEASAGRTKRKAMAAAKKLLAEKACTVRELQGYFKVMGMLAGD